MLKHLKICASVGAVIFVMTSTSCVTSPDVIFVDTTQDVIRLGKNVTGFIFYRDGSGKWIRSNNKVKLPAGWYAGGLPAEE